MSKQDNNLSLIHADHRQRMKKRFIEGGLDDFSDIQVLELLLFYCIPRKDTNRIAHALLTRFGSFAQVMEATPEELMQVEGMGQHSAVFLSLVTQAGRYYQVNRMQQIRQLTTIKECGDYLTPFFGGRRNEMVYLLGLDAKCKILGCKKVGEGSINSAGFSIRRVVETALSFNATSVVLAHNHPSGIALPSGDDIQTTVRLAKALDTVEIVLVDHIVVADNEFVSIKQSGLMPSGCGV